jgi:LmbE family N-acetylglucosaminyl deacetylase
MKRIEILGWYNKNNVGDDAFQIVLGDWFANHDVRFVTPPMKTREDADLVILGGGAVASNYYLEAITQTTKRIPCIVLGVDIEYPAEAELLARFGFDEVVFRSREDVITYQNIPDFLTNNARYCPDLAFHLTASGKPVLPSYKKKDRRTLGVFVTDYVMPSRDRDLYHFGPRADQFAQGLGGVLDQLSEKCEIVFLPCSTGNAGDDRRINRHVASFMEHAPTIIDDQLDPKRMIDLIAGCTATLCMRYHAHIFSLIAGTPFASIEFTKKVATLMGEYQPRVERPLVAVTKQEDGYFNFDHAYENTLAAIVAGSHDDKDEHAIAKEYAADCRERVNSMNELILSEWT